MPPRNSTSSILSRERTCLNLPAGPVAIAAGFQYRDDQLESLVDEISAEDGFGFLIGSDSFDASIDVYALFAEVSVPLTEWFDVQAAVRFEDFGANGGTTVDPKVALLLRPTDWLSVRGTYSTSFRAPTSFQQFGQSTSLNNIADPGPDGIIGTADDGGTAFGAVRAFGSADCRRRSGARKLPCLQCRADPGTRSTILSSTSTTTISSLRTRSLSSPSRPW